MTQARVEFSSLKETRPKEIPALLIVTTDRPTAGLSNIHAARGFPSAYFPPSMAF